MNPTSEIRTAELMAALSIATDLGMGQPLEFAMRSCIASVRFGEKLGFNDDELQIIYYQALLRYIGCNAETHFIAAIFGDELAFRKNIIHADATSTDFMRQTIQALRVANSNASPLGMLQSIASGLIEANRYTEEYFIGHCEVAERLAKRLHLESQVVQSIKQVYARWDGKGVPKLKGEEISQSMLAVSLMQDALFIYQLNGIDSAIEVIKKRKGKMYAPKQVEVFCKHATELLKEENTNWETVLNIEPNKKQMLTESQFNSACEAIADFTDIKSPFLLGHSIGVARVAVSAAKQAGLTESTVTELRRAALLHDIGRVGVSAGIWGKQNPLTESDWEKIRLHPYYTERVLARSEKLFTISKIASMHHERLDGSGYHRGANSTMMNLSMRILAAADMYQALLENRPHRAALQVDSASVKLLAEAQANRLDKDAVNFVLASQGQVVAMRKDFPAGLSEREVAVLKLIARGQTIKQMAEQLTIAPKTVDSHIQHIYQKINVNTRASATLYAMENDLL
jgi:HD-GYP domain-containing protein (c-di-GMP phosphodiesterase class II)